MNLHAMVEHFVGKWGPARRAKQAEFIIDLRLLLEAYGKAALQHESLPDTEHEHGDPA